MSMIARELISDEILPLKTSTLGSDAIHLMQDYHVRHLPIVNNEQLLGLISEDDILNGQDMKEAVGSYELAPQRAYVYDKDHIYEIMRLLHESKLTLVPVVDKKTNYLGVVTLNDLLKYFAESASFKEQGSVIVLTVTKHNYTLSQIARIVESEGAIILNSFITSIPDSMEIDITLKINRTDLTRIMASFSRYGYEIKASFTEAEVLDSLQENYDSLMSYLNM